MSISDELTLDLRRAYRLVHGYQRAVLDLSRTIGAELDLEFYFWEPKRQGRPARGTTQPADNYAWDMLPLYNAAFTYVTPGRIVPGSYMLYLTAEADTGYEPLVKRSRREPDYRELPPPEKCETRLSFMHAQVTSGNPKRSTSFWDALYDKEWPELPAFSFDFMDVRLHGGLMHTPLTNVADLASLKAVLSTFRSRLQLTHRAPNV